MLTFDRTYNDTAAVSVFGESVQDGIPTPDSPVPIESRASACVETSNADGSKTSTTDLTSILDGRELRSLPDGTMDEVQVRDNGDGTGDVVLVGRVGNIAMTDIYWNRLDFSKYPNGYVFYGNGRAMQQRINHFNFMCDSYINSINRRYNELKNYEISGYGGAGTSCWLRNDDYTSVADLVASFGGSRLSFPLATPTETVLGTITMPETFYDETHVWEADGADISANVKVIQ